MRNIKSFFILNWPSVHKRGVRGRPSSQQCRQGGEAAQAEHQPSKVGCQHPSCPAHPPSLHSTDFPQITLDPETAHPCLVLSDDYRCVRDGHLRRDVPDTPMRFNYCVAVLGCQGFSSGKHYWEVEVGNKPSWTLGLVSTSINRKGKISASPGNGYWVIRLRNGMELTAKDTPPQRLCPIAFPKRVGVYLDYNAGIASFYDASTMVHLYTFSNPRFTGRLFPYFCPGLYNSGENATPLKICRIPLL
uniref:B30.2/SPRY domain-containing protein n=1 Tax=Varanus komodoensis TaxID=61221 RepID=A0A8D2IP44_VARKO